MFRDRSTRDFWAFGGKSLRIIGVLVLVCAGDIEVASAQNPRGRGPFTRLFGIGPESTNSQALNVRASVFGMWQNISFGGDIDPASLDPALAPSGTFQNGSFAGTVGSIDYTFNRRSQASSVFATGQAWILEYSTTPEKPQYGGTASVGLFRSARLTRRITFLADANALYSPYFNFTPTPLTQTSGGINPIPIAVTPGLNINALSVSNASVNGSAGLSARVSARSTFSAGVIVQQVYFLDDAAAAANLTELRGQAMYTHQLRKKLSAHAGYFQSQSRLHDPDRWSDPLRGLDFGLDYGDALQLTRRTVLTFGGSLASTRAVPGSTAVSGSSTQYRVLGGANLIHFVGRTWVASAGVNRTLGFVAGFREPVLSDTAIASLTGQLATRVSWSSGASWSRGYIGLDTSRHYDTTAAASSLFIAVTRRIATFAQISYYSNRVPATASLLPVFANFDQQVASVGLTFFQPIFNSQRSR